MQSLVVEFIDQQKEFLIKQWREELRNLDLNKGYGHVSEDVTEEIIDLFIELVYDTTQGKEQEQEFKIRRFADRAIHYGLPLSDFIRGLQMLQPIIVHAFGEQENAEKTRALSLEVANWVDDRVTRFVDAFMKTHENTLDLQKVALKELSAPLIPVFDKISVMPLVGTIDTERAKYIMENLLEGIIEHRAEVVLIDITGVPVVDTMVAHHIIRASEAVRLVGAKCILVGIRPEIAQTIISLGIDLSDFPTKNNLKKGIESALEITQRQIIDKKDPRLTEV